MLSVRILFRHRPDRAGATAYGQNRINAPAYRPVVTTRRPTTPPASGTEKSAPAPARHSRQNMAWRTRYRTQKTKCRKSGHRHPATACPGVLPGASH